MLKRILFGALFAPLLALAQSYPSPTFNNLTVNGTFTATGKVGLGSLASQAANTAVANVTGSSASPAAVALPSCSSANGALQYTSGAGFSCSTSFALTTGTLGQFAATTSSQLAGVISDETGSGSLVFGTSPTINGASIGQTTPGAGSFTTLSANSTVSGSGFSTYLASPPAIGGTAAAAGSFTTLQASGAFTPSQTAGIVGTTTNNNANAGAVGEFICALVTNGGSPTGCATNTSTPVSLTTNTPANVTSVSLSAGDWQCYGVAMFFPAGTTITVQTTAALSTTSATLPGNSQTANSNPPGTAGLGVQFVVPTVRVLASGTTTVYLVSNSVFNTSTETAGGRIDCRRAR